MVRAPQMPSLGMYHSVLDLPLPTIRQVSVMVWTWCCISRLTWVLSHTKIMVKKCQHCWRSFVYADTIDRTGCNNTVRTMKGTRELHCIQNTGIPGVLKVHRSSCTCRCVCYIINIIIVVMYQ